MKISRRELRGGGQKRGAEGGEGRGMGRGVPLPGRLMDLGSVVSSASGPRPKTGFGAFGALKNTCWHNYVIFRFST